MKTTKPQKIQRAIEFFNYEKEVKNITDKFNVKSKHFSPNYFKLGEATKEEVTDRKEIDKLRSQFNVEIENLSVGSSWIPKKNYPAN